MYMPMAFTLFIPPPDSLMSLLICFAISTSDVLSSTLYAIKGFLAPKINPPVELNHDLRGTSHTSAILRNTIRQVHHRSRPKELNAKNIKFLANDHQTYLEEKWNLLPGEVYVRCRSKGYAWAGPAGRCRRGRPPSR